MLQIGCLIQHQFMCMLFTHLVTPFKSLPRYFNVPDYHHLSMNSGSAFIHYAKGSLGEVQKIAKT